MSRWAVVAIATTIGCGRINFDPFGGDGRVHHTLLLDQFDAGESLLDFPIAVILGDDRIDASIVAPDGSDLRFYDEAGANLPYELELAFAPFIAWVRVPRIEGTTTRLTLRYGDLDAPVATGQVWDASFEAVWHLSGDTHDSTGNGHDGVPLNSVAAGGFRGGGWDFNPAQQSAILVAQTPAFSQVTLSGLINTRSTTPLYDALIARQLGNTQNDELYVGTFSGDIYASIETDSGTYSTIGSAVPDVGWHQLAMTYDGSVLHGYVDGVTAISLPAGGALVTTAGNPIFLGANRDDLDGTGAVTVPDDDFLDGSLDEVRIERVARSIAWINATRASIGDAWITYGPAEYD